MLSEARTDQIEENKYKISENESHGFGSQANIKSYRKIK